MPVDDLTKGRLVFLQVARFTTYQLFIAVLNVQDTIAYTIDEFFVTV